MSYRTVRQVLVHISEVADNYVKDINEHLKVGDMVEVKVMNVGTDGKIGLSIRKAKPESEQRPERPQRPQRPRQGVVVQANDRPENFETKDGKIHER